MASSVSSLDAASGSALRPIPAALYSPILLMPALAIAATTAALIFTKTGRDGLYVSQSDVLGIPWAYLLVAIAAPGAAMASIAVLRLLGANSTRLVLLGSVSILQLVTLPLVIAGGTGSLVVWFASIPVVFGVLLSILWILGAEVAPLANRSVSDVYNFFGAIALSAGVVSSAVVWFPSDWAGPEAFVLTGSALLAVAMGMVWGAQARLGAPTGLSPNAARPSVSSVGFAQVLRNRYIRLLGIAMIASGFSGVLIEFWFYSAVDAISHTNSSRTTSFSLYYLATNASALLVQVFLVPVTQRQLGLGTSLVILPLALSFGSLLLVARMLPPSGFRMLESSLKNSLQRSTWEQSYVLIAGALRSTVKLIIDGMVFRLGEGVAAILLLSAGTYAVTADSVNLSAPTALTLVLCLALWVFTTFRLRQLIQTQEQCMLSQQGGSALHPPEGCSLTAFLFAEQLLQPAENDGERMPDPTQEKS